MRLASLAVDAPEHGLAATDRRSAPRVRVTIRVQVRSGADSFVAHSSDVSANGLFLESRRTLPVGSVVHLSFLVGGTGGGTPVEVEGEVVRAVEPSPVRDFDAPPGIGVVFGRFLWGGQAFAHDLAARLREGGGLRLLPARARARQRRVAVGLPVYWGHDGRGRRAGLLTNLSSRGGFFLETDATVALGARLLLSFEVPVDGEARLVRAQGTVTRVVDERGDGASGMGVALLPSPLDEATLAAFLDGHCDQVTLQRERERQLERSHPTRIDALFREALADWERNGEAALGAGDPPEAGGAPPIAADTATPPTVAGRVAADAVDWWRTARVALGWTGVLVATLLVAVVVALLELV